MHYEVIGSLQQLLSTWTKASHYGEGTVVGTLEEKALAFSKFSTLTDLNPVS